MLLSLHINVKKNFAKYTCLMQEKETVLMCTVPFEESPLRSLKNYGHNTFA